MSSYDQDRSRQKKVFAVTGYKDLQAVWNRMWDPIPQDPPQALMQSRVDPILLGGEG